MIRKSFQRCEITRFTLTLFIVSESKPNKEARIGLSKELEVIKLSLLQIPTVDDVRLNESDKCEVEKGNRIF